LGRTAAGLAEVISGDIASGLIPGGRFLPSERELAHKHAADRKTVRRALKSLESRGFLETVPRRGYRVLHGAADPDRGCPVAFVAGGGQRVRTDGSMGRLMQALGDAADRRGWSLLSTGTGGQGPQEVLAQLRAARAFGVALDVEDPPLVAAIRESGIPTVMVNAWDLDSGLDSVMQDGQLGGLLAVRHLVERGCRRIAWFGNYKRNEHTTDRFSGAAAALRDAELPLEPEMTVSASPEDAETKARELLSRPDRPDGAVCLWRSRSIALARAARELGLTVGKDFHLVGWCPEEFYETAWLPEFAGGPVPPAVVWSIQTMAETTLSRLAERRQNPELPALRVKVPVRLRLKAEG